MASVHGLVRGGPGQSQWASEGGEYGAAEPLPVGTVAEQDRGAVRMGPVQPWASFPPGAQAGHRRGTASSGLPASVGLTSSS